VGERESRYGRGIGSGTFIIFSYWCPPHGRDNKEKDGRDGKREMEEMVSGREIWKR